MGEALRQAALEFRSQGRAFRRARHHQPRTGLLVGQEDEPQGAHGSHGHAGRLRSRAWAGVGRDQLEWLSTTLADWAQDAPLVVFSHNPLYEYYPPWNFWVRDWREVQEVLRPFSNVTNIHGHTHQVLYNEIGSLRSIGMLATSWPWPYAPEGVPILTTPHIRADPGDHFDGVGWAQLDVSDAGRVDNEYKMWRKEILAEAPWDSGTGDNGNQVLSPRIADRQWPY